MHDLLQAMWESTEALRCVIEAGANVNARDVNGYPMLFWAITDGDNAAGLVRTLVEAGADVNVRDDRYPMLFWAIIEGDNAVELVRTLVEAGADVNARDDNGRSMLYWAIIQDNLEVVQLLVDAGATE